MTRIRFDGCVLSPDRAPRSPEASIVDMARDARYDEIAEWYDGTMVSPVDGRLALRLLGTGQGRLLDVGCGGGTHMLAFREAGWMPVGVDASDQQLALARARGCDVLHARGEELPFDDASFDAAVSMWTHTDVEDFPAVLREVARVLRPGGIFVYLGVHPCFVGPHSEFVAGEGVPRLHPGYRRAGRYDDAPGISPNGLRARIGATHIPLGLFLQAFLDAGLRLEHVEEPGERDYPVPLALRALR
jgi:SAM-dependent methyltransferase